MKKYLPIFILSPLVIILDQITKQLILDKLQIGQRMIVWSGIFDIVHVRNRGAAFGMLADWDSGAREWFFYGVSFVALLALSGLYIKSKPAERKVHIPLALILGGAIGNIIDRLRFGNVVDFLRLHWHDQWSWPSFNVADMAISCGSIYLVIVMVFFANKER